MIGYRTIGAAAFFAAGMVAGAPVQAQSVIANANAIAQILRDKNLTVEVTTDNEGDPLLRSSLGENRGFSIYFYGCTNHANCTAAQFYSNYKTKKPDDARINLWNRKHRYGRGYIDTDGQPAVEMDINMLDGMPRKLFDDNFEVWKTLMDTFSKFVFGDD